MIGKESPVEIRKKLLAAHAKSGIDIATWFNERISKLETERGPKVKQIETLKLLRDGLLAVPKRKRRSAKRVRPRSRTR